MSAAAERAAFAGAGRTLVAATGSPGERRAAALTARPSPAPPTVFATLLDAPEWLGWPEEERQRLAQVVALRLIAPALARSIDGAWLGALAEAAGDDALDWAIARGDDGEPDAGNGPDGDGAMPQPDALAAYGLAILGSQLPASLRSYLRGSGTGAVIVPGSIVAESLAFVAERGR